MKTFRGLNKTIKVPFPRPKVTPVVQTTIPGSTPDNGKLRESTNPDIGHDFKRQPKPKKEEQPFKLDNTVKGLKRRMKNSGGHMLLKPQAEEVMFEARKKVSELKAGDKARFSGQAADGTVSGDMDVHVINPHSNAHLVTHMKDGRSYEGSFSHIPTATVERPERKGAFPSPAKQFTAHHHMLKKLSEAYAAPDTGNNNYAQSLPVPAGTKKTNMNKKLRKDTMTPSASYEDSVIMSLSDLDLIFESYINEELKVGEDADGNNEAKKFRGTNAKGPGTGKVKRRYLGKSRGTTATGKPAHGIDVEPVIGAQDKNWNKTTPSGDRKK